MAASSPSTRGSIINHVCCTVCLPASNSELYALEMVRLCLESVPAALFARGRTSVYLRKRAIWAQSLRSSFHCLPLLLCSFLLTLGLTRALFSCFGRRRTRDRRFFHLKLVVDGPVNGRQQEASDAFCARLSSSALRRSAACPASAAFGREPRTLGSTISLPLNASLHAHERCSLYLIVCSPQCVYERGLDSMAGVLYTLQHAEYTLADFY